MPEHETHQKTRLSVTCISRHQRKLVSQGMNVIQVFFTPKFITQINLRFSYEGRKERRTRLKLFSYSAFFSLSPFFSFLPILLQFKRHSIKIVDSILEKMAYNKKNCDFCFFARRLFMRLRSVVAFDSDACSAIRDWHKTLGI